MLSFHPLVGIQHSNRDFGDVAHTDALIYLIKMSGACDVRRREFKKDVSTVIFHLKVNFMPCS